MHAILRTGQQSAAGGVQIYDEWYVMRLILEDMVGLKL